MFGLKLFKRIEALEQALSEEEVIQLQRRLDLLSRLEKSRTNNLKMFSLKKKGVKAC